MPERIFADQAGGATAVVAADPGLVAVTVAGDTSGVFSLAYRGTVLGVSAAGTDVAVATDEDVLVGDDESLEETGFGPAMAVGGDPLLAAAPDGRIGRWLGDRDDPEKRRGDGEDDGWADLGTVDGTVRRIDGDLLATDAGVYRVRDDAVEHAGLADVRDVATPGVPHAATADGLYRLGAGWMHDREGEFTVVASDPESATSAGIGRAHAATTDGLFVHRDGEWREEPLPVDGPVVDVAYGPTAYAVTEDGTFLLETADGWVARSLGVSGVAGLAVLPADSNA